MRGRKKANLLQTKETLTAGGLLVKLLLYTWLVIMTLCVLIPFYVIFKMSITGRVESLQTMGFIWFPKMGATLEAYKTALFDSTFDIYGISILKSFFNTLWQTIPTVLIGLFVSGMAAFAYAKLCFPGKGILFGLTLMTMMIPGAVLTMPSYIYYDMLGWSHSVLPIVIPGMFGGAMTIFFLRQFFEGIPSDLLDAAKIDGMGFFTMYIKIMIPLAGPAFIAQFVFAFIGGYNSYMGPLLYLNGQTQLYPLQMTLSLFRGIFASDNTIVAALTIIALVPLLIVYIFLQKYFVEGVATTGVKG